MLELLQSLYNRLELWRSRTVSAKAQHSNKSARHIILGIIMSRSDQIRRLRERDGDRCGPHLGGCGQSLIPGLETVDHIIPQNILKLDKAAYVELSEHEGFMQLMCRRCNNGTKRGEALWHFTCDCHRIALHGTNRLSIIFIRHRHADEVHVRLPLENRGEVLLVPGITKTGDVGYIPRILGGILENTLPDVTNTSSILTRERILEFSNWQPVGIIEKHDKMDALESAYPIEIYETKENYERLRLRMKSITNRLAKKQRFMTNRILKGNHRSAFIMAALTSRQILAMQGMAGSLINQQDRILKSSMRSARINIYRFSHHPLLAVSGLPRVKGDLPL